MSYLNFLVRTSSGSASSNSTISGEQNSISVKWRGQLRNMIDFLDAGNGASLVFIHAAGVRKVAIGIQRDTATTYSIEARISDGLFIGGLSIAALTSGTDYIVYYAESNTSQGGIFGFLGIYDTAGVLVSSATRNYSVAPFPTGGEVAINYQVGQDRTTGRVDGVAIYTGSSAWKTGADRYNAPTASDPGIVSGWLFQETSGGSAANLVGGAQSLSITGTENTDFAWATGGGWPAPPTGPQFRSASTTASASTNAPQGLRPAGTADGDGLIAIVITRPPTQDFYGTLVPPSGWNEEVVISPPSPGRVRVSVYSKIASSEPTSWTWNWSITNQAYVIVLAYTGCSTADLIDQVVAQFNAAADATCETPPVGPTSAPGRLVSFYLHGNGIDTGYFGAGATLASGTERAELDDDAVGGRLIMVVGDELYLTPALLTSRVSTADFGATPSIGVSILLRDATFVPAAGSPLLLLRGFGVNAGLNFRV